MKPSDIFGNYNYANEELCKEWNNNIPCSKLDSPDFILLTDSQDLKALCDYLSFLPCENITGALVKINDGDYSEVYITEWSRPYDLTAIYTPLDYYLD